MSSRSAGGGGANLGAQPVAHGDSFLPSVPLGDERPQPVWDAVAGAVVKIWAAGKIAGTLVFEHEMTR